MSILVPNANGKLRRTPDGKLRAGCCACDCASCDLCTHDVGDDPETPCYLALTFEDISVPDCIFDLGASRCCHLLTVPPLDITVICAQHPDFPCCWLGDTGLTVTRHCDCDPTPSSSPITNRIIAAVTLNGLLWRIQLKDGGNITLPAPVYPGCEAAPAVGNSLRLFYATYPAFDPAYDTFCYGPVERENANPGDGSTTACQTFPGSTNWYGYGGTVTVAPL